MEITEVRIKLIENTEDRLRGFCSITFDDMFVVRDLKIIEGNSGPFVAMPSRKLTANCHKCRTKNHLRANYCNQCGGKVRHDRIEHDAGGRAKLYADVAHPVNAECREMIQNRVIEELNREVERSRLPGYSSRYDEDYFDDDPGPAASPPPSKRPAFIDVPDEIMKIKKQRESGSAQPSDERSSKEPPSEEAKQPDEPRQRIDDASDNRPSPHKPEEGVSQDSNSTDDEFGQGIFE
ncbi:MAG: septation protein SpoVG family protein [Planctomycetota bacterium]